MFKENITTELKRKYHKDIIKTVVAFANSKGGKIIIGVDDFKKVVGVNHPDKTLLSLTNAVRDGIKPDVSEFTSSSIHNYDGKTLIIYQVQRGTARPYYIAAKGLKPSGVYIRQGASSVPASRATILKMIKETDSDSYEECRALNQQLTFNALDEVFEQSNLTLKEPQFKTLGLIDADNLYTNLALLLSDQCHHTIKAAVYQGTSKNHFRDRYEFSGSLIKQMKETYAFIDRYNRTKSVINGLVRVDTRDYPETALREALINSIIHKDYSFGSDTLISLFDDRIEILTVGGLVKGITKQDILIGTSILRNKKLANIFYRLKWIEAYGTGIIKINDSYQKSANKPRIDITDNAFKITLPIIKVNQNLEVPQFQPVDHEKQILSLLEANGTLSRKIIQQELKLSQTMTGRLLNKLIAKKLVQRIGLGKNTLYQLSSDFDNA